MSCFPLSSFDTPPFNVIISHPVLDLDLVVSGRVYRAKTDRKSGSESPVSNDMKMDERRLSIMDLLYHLPDSKGG